MFGIEFPRVCFRYGKADLLRFCFEELGTPFIQDAFFDLASSIVDFGPPFPTSLETVSVLVEHPQFPILSRGHIITSLICALLDEACRANGAIVEELMLSESNRPLRETIELMQNLVTPLKDMVYYLQSIADREKRTNLLLALNRYASPNDPINSEAVSECLFRNHLQDDNFELLESEILNSIGSNERDDEAARLVLLSLVFENLTLVNGSKVLDGCISLLSNPSTKSLFSLRNFYPQIRQFFSRAMMRGKHALVEILLENLSRLGIEPNFFEDFSLLYLYAYADYSLGKWKFFNLPKLFLMNKIQFPPAWWTLTLPIFTTELRKHADRFAGVDGFYEMVTFCFEKISEFRETLMKRDNKGRLSAMGHQWIFSGDLKVTNRAIGCFTLLLDSSVDLMIFFI